MRHFIRTYLLQIGFPAVAPTKPAMKKAVALLAGNFEVLGMLPLLFLLGGLIVDNLGVHL
jgi:hypothetical protein